MLLLLLLLAVAAAIVLLPVERCPPTTHDLGPLSLPVLNPAHCFSPVMRGRGLFASGVRSHRVEGRSRPPVHIQRSCSMFACSAPQALEQPARGTHLAARLPKTRRELREQARGVCAPRLLSLEGVEADLGRISRSSTFTRRIEGAKPDVIRCAMLTFVYQNDLR